MRTASGWLAAAGPAPQPLPGRTTLARLAPFALTVAVPCSLDTLLATSLIDGRQRPWRDPHRALLAQGLAGIATAATGAQPASPSVPRSPGIGGVASPVRQAVRLQLPTADVARWIARADAHLPSPEGPRAALDGIGMPADERPWSRGD